MSIERKPSMIDHRCSSLTIQRALVTFQTKMDSFKTPQKTKPGQFLLSSAKKDTVKIPPSPFLKRIGYGTGIAVYKMERSPLSNRVRSPWAVKKLIKTKTNTEEIKTRLKDEATILRQLSHPNVVGFRAFVKNASGQECLAMEECTHCLGNLIEERNEEGLDAFEPAKIMKVAVDIANALDYLHNKALLLHCDIKSYNVLIKGEFDVCKLCDFGVALPLKPDGYVDVEKVKDEFVEYAGTRLWQPIETLEEDKQIITTKADIYSYGLVLWEMLALCPPQCFASVDISVDSFDDSILEESLTSNIDNVGYRPPLPPQNFGEEYNKVIEIFYCCTHEDFEQRPSAKLLCSILTDKN